jgi:exopolysaccharide biosynthesis protein
VRDGRELQPPGHGPLSAAFVVDTAGRPSIAPAESIAVLRASGTVRLAFQSYPAVLLGDGDVVAPLRAAGRGVDVAHRDARLAIGELRDGRILIALTRFDAVGEALETLPFGLTAPETAALMGALGARRAVLLDGGISAQLTLRGADGQRKSWRGIRRVPLALVARPR